MNTDIYNLIRVNPAELNIENIMQYILAGCINFNDIEQRRDLIRVYLCPEPVEGSVAKNIPQTNQILTP